MNKLLSLALCKQSPVSTDLGCPVGVGGGHSSQKNAEDLSLRDSLIQ